MFYVNKIIGWVLSPFGILYLGLLVVWLMRGLWPRLSKTMLVLVLASFWLLGTDVMTIVLGVPLEREFVRDGQPCGAIGEDLPQVELIVLLGGGLGVHEKCGAMELFQSADRAVTAASLWRTYEKHGVVTKIVCTGGGVERSTVPFLVSLGVPREVIEFSESPRITAEEAALIRSRGISRIALVTSAWHMRRARMLFVRQGVDVEPFAADFESMFVNEGGFSPMGFFPSGDGLFKNTALLKEWVAIAGYSVFR